MSHTPVQDLLAALKSNRKRRGYAVSSEHRNGHYLRAFAEWAGGRQLGEITAVELDQGFLSHWCESFRERNGRDPSPKTLSNLISQLRALYDYAERFDLLVDANGQPVRNPMARIDAPKIKREIKEWLTEEELERLLLAATSPDELFTVVWLSMSAMRIGEAGGVLWRDVDLAGGSILIRSGKSNAAARQIAISSELIAHLQRHLERQQERGLAGPTTPVFCTRHGNPILEQQANRTLKRIAKRAGITTNVSCHGLRRSWAMAALARGMSTEAVAAHLGHSDPSVTAAHYARVQFPQVQEEVREAFG